MEDEDKDKLMNDPDQPAATPQPIYPMAYDSSSESHDTDQSEHDVELSRPRPDLNFDDEDAEKMRENALNGMPLLGMK